MPKQTIELSASLHEAMRLHAADAGYVDLGKYIADLIKNDFVNFTKDSAAHVIGRAVNEMSEVEQEAYDASILRSVKQRLKKD